MDNTELIEHVVDWSKTNLLIVQLPHDIVVN